MKGIDKQLLIDQIQVLLTYIKRNEGNNHPDMEQEIMEMRDYIEAARRLL